jgi:DNA topoisomerase-1
MDHKAYLSDPGIYRNGNRFYYHKNKKEVTDGVLLQRLSKLVVPPAWSSVWYASKSRCHIQVYGIDGGGKKQYILSQQWVKNSRSEKFHRMK